MLSTIFLVAAGLVVFVSSQQLSQVDRQWYESEKVLYVTFCFDYFNRGRCRRAECRHVHDTEERAKDFFAGRLGISVELRKDVRRLLHLTAEKRKAAAETAASRSSGRGGHGNIGEGRAVLCCTTFYLSFLSL